MIRPALLAAALLTGGAAHAETTTDASLLAGEAARKLQAAAVAFEEAADAPARQRALADAQRGYEEAQAALRTGLRLAAYREQTLTADLAGREATSGQLLGELMSTSRAQAPVILTHPAGPLGAVRANMLAADLARTAQARADSLRDQTRELAILRALNQSTADTFQDSTAEMQTPPGAAGAPGRLREASRTLEGIARSLAALETVTTAPLFFAERKGQLPLPVQGTLLRAFNAPDEIGARRPGLVLAARPGAEVSAPALGTIRHAGPLADYGNVMILEPERGFLLVFAGLGSVYGAIGDVVPEGAALGLMGTGANVEFPGDDPLVDDAEPSATLYMELRQGDTPVDPAEWFASTKKE